MADRLTIKEYYDTRRGEPIVFRPHPHYIPSGDYLSIFFTDDFAYSERIDESITVYKSAESGEIVGCKIKGVSLLARNIVNIFQYEDDTHEIEIRLLLLTARGSQPTEPSVTQISEKMGETKVPLARILKDQAA